MSFLNRPKSAFQASRLVPNVFLIKEYDDIYNEHPHIYARVIPENTVVVIDTGCGGFSVDPTVQITSLRQFIETYPVDDNGGVPLNEGGKMGYIVILTHCHYDHILGIADFEGHCILASSHSPDFVSEKALPQNSLCKALGIKTPSYASTLVPHLHTISSPSTGQSLRITVLHTPGHTPDELALYDEEYRMLYVGDSLYEYEPIIFPKEGSIVTWLESVQLLVTFVKERNGHVLPGARDPDNKEVSINCGHCTTMKPAMEVLLSTLAFMQDIIQGREEIKGTLNVRGEKNVVYNQDGGRFSLRCPERLINNARKAAALSV